MLKRVKNWRFGPTVNGTLSDHKYIPNEFGAGLMGVYTSQDYEIRASLAHKVERGIDNSSYVQGNSVKDTMALTYVRALDNNWFLNLNVQNSEETQITRRRFIADFDDETFRRKMWSVWVTKRF